MAATRSLVHFCIGVAALAAIAGGVACTSEAGQASNSTPEFAPTRISQDADAQQLIDWLSTRSMPMLDQARAERELAG